jgi:HEAT repeat protein
MRTLKAKYKNKTIAAILAAAVLCFGIVILVQLNSRPQQSSNLHGHSVIAMLGSTVLPGDINEVSSAFEALDAEGPKIIPELRMALLLQESWVANSWVEIYSKLGRAQRFFVMPIKRSAIRANAATALGRLGPEAKETIPDLMQILEGPCDATWKAAADALVRITRGKHPEVVAKLVEELGDPDAERQASCVQSLGHYVDESPEARAALHKVMQESSDTDLRESAAHLLGLPLHKIKP